MSEVKPESTTVIVDEGEMQMHYVNAYRVHQTTEELFLDVGVSMPNPNGPGILMNIHNRLVFSYPNAKKIQEALAKAIKQFEASKA